VGAALIGQRRDPSAPALVESSRVQQGPKGRQNPAKKSPLPPPAIGLSLSHYSQSQRLFAACALINSPAS